MSRLVIHRGVRQPWARTVSVQSSVKDETDRATEPRQRFLGGADWLWSASERNSAARTIPSKFPFPLARLSVAPLRTMRRGRCSGAEAQRCRRRFGP